MIIEAFKKAHENFPDGGTCLEFGVYIGHSYMRQVKEIINNYPNSKLIGFDSWQGLPEETAGVWFPERHAKGKFSTTKDIVLSKLGELKNDPRFQFVDGFYDKSLTSDLQKTISNLIFVNIDVDIHKSCVQVLEFIRPLLQKGTILYFDDWKDPKDTYDGKWGEHLAWEQFSSKHKIEHKTLRINKYNQRYIEIE